MQDAKQVVTDALRHGGFLPNEPGKDVRTFAALCPVHGDRNPSLVVGIDEYGALETVCKSRGCTTPEIADALALPIETWNTPGILSDPATNKTTRYDYVNEDGTLVGYTIRTDMANSRKSFDMKGIADGKEVKARDSEVQSTPYRLPELLSAIERGETVYIVEGERNADDLHAIGVAATTNIGGGGAWKAAHARWFTDAVVAVIQDNDEPGRKRTTKVLESLEGIARSVTVWESATGELKDDVSDHLAAGYSLAELVPVGGPGEREPSSWAPVDLTAILSGEYTAEYASVLARDDGKCLFYAGKVSSLYGESESGKSLIAQLAVVRELEAGNRVAFIDYETDALSVVNRLRALGADDAAIGDRLDYLRPEEKHNGRRALEDFEHLLTRKYSLVVIDGMTEGFATESVSSIDNDDVSVWVRSVPKPIADATGAAVILIDHVTKSKDTRGRFAIGAQAKLAALTGVGYLVEPESPIGVGMVGQLNMRVTKDKPGTIRPISHDHWDKNRSQLTATIEIDSRSGDGRIRSKVLAHDSMERVTGGVAESSEEYLDEIMTKVAEEVKKQPGITKTAVRSRIKGYRTEKITAAVEKAEERRLVLRLGQKYFPPT